MAHKFRAFVTAGALACTLMSTTAIAAAPMSAPAVPAAMAASRYDAVDATARHGCWRGCGWGYDRYRRDRVDAGDVILGAVLIGGIAALISSENKRERERDRVVLQRDPYERPDDRRATPRSIGTSGLDNAANMCVERIEREARVDMVDNVARNAAGWQVTGVLANGSPFDCRIGNDGQIESVDYDANAATADGQWSDDTYATARASVGGTVRPDLAVQETTVQVAAASPPSAHRVTADRMPAYPGGPIDGEEIPENPPGE